MQVGLILNYNNRSVKRPLAVTATANPEFAIATVDNESTAELMSMLIPTEWQETLLSIAKQERALINKRRTLLAQYRAEFKQIIKDCPELLI